MNKENKKFAVVSYSGGMDSTCLILHLLAEGYTVRAISFDYGQSHSIELKRAKKNIKYFQKLGLPVEHQIINLRDVFSGDTSTLVKHEKSPEGDYREETMKSTVVCNRNVIFSSVIFAKALSLAKTLGQNVLISLGVHGGDHCFTGDTYILTPSGMKTVETLKIGDDIFSVDPENQSVHLDKCIDIIQKGLNNEIYNIRTTSGNIKLTSEHEVYTCDLNNSIIKKKVKNLVVGDFMVSCNDSRKPENIITTEIKEIYIDTSKTEKVYDISVEKNHNFFAGSLGNVLISNSIYPDCREESVNMARELYRISNWDSELVEYDAPFVNYSKSEVLNVGLSSARKLGFDNKQIRNVFKNTVSCYNATHDGKSCGKCGTCTERLEAFWANGLNDPAKYVDKSMGKCPKDHAPIW